MGASAVLGAPARGSQRVAVAAGGRRCRAPRARALGSPPMRSARGLVLIAVAAIAMAGCGGQKSNPNQGGGGASPVPGLALPPQASDINVKPPIPKPKGSPPGGLTTRDVVQGNGKVAASGDTLSVQYVGVSWSTGQEFDSSWSRGKKPLEFQLGA